MPKQTNWVCDNPKCSKKHNGSPHTPDGWREVHLMNTPPRVNGQGGGLCGECAEVISHMLPPPLDAAQP